MFTSRSQLRQLVVSLALLRLLHTNGGMWIVGFVLVVLCCTLVLSSGVAGSSARVLAVELDCCCSCRAAVVEVVYHLAAFIIIDMPGWRLVVAIMADGKPGIIREY